MINMHTQCFDNLPIQPLVIRGGVPVGQAMSNERWAQSSPSDLQSAFIKRQMDSLISFSLFKAESSDWIFLFVVLSFDGSVLFSRSYLDMSKVIIFSYLFWFVLTIIFITGTTRISIFCMGYLVACFYFLLFGGDLLLKPIKSILRYWDWLIAYNVFVITMKNILSVSGSHCVTHLWFQCKSKQSVQWLLKAHCPSHCSLKSSK